MSADAIINLLNVTALMSIMLAMGLKVSMEELFEAAKEKRTIFLALFANYALVPLITFLLLCFVNPDPLVSAGFLILAVCPAAPLGPPLTEIARGNVPMSVGLMLILAALSSLLSPMLLTLLLSQLTPNSTIQIDYFGIVKVLLIAQLLPLIAGLAIRKWASKIASRIDKPIDKLSKILFASVLAIILASQYKALAMVHLRGWVAMTVLFVASVGIGWICGGKARSTRIALALVTATRNGGVGLVIALANFSGTPAIASVVVYTLFSTLGSVMLALSCRRKVEQL